MADYTRPATWQDLKSLVKYLGDANFADDQRYALRVNDEFTVDVMPSIAGHSWNEMQPYIMQPYIETIDFEGINLKLLNLDGLLITKQGVRPKDQMDAALLRRALAALGKSKPS